MAGFPLLENLDSWVMKAGQTFVKASGSSGTFFNFTSALSLIGSRSSPSCSELGCWKMEMLAPWNDVFAAVAVGLWSMYFAKQLYCRRCDTARSDFDASYVGAAI